MTEIMFYCPIDDLSLAITSSGLKCPKGHSFDKAREGYYNLLLVQNKSSADPGDNKEMVESRRRFLANGYYDPIAERLVSLTKSICDSDARILDAGCGEGFYLGKILAELPHNQYYGIDISKAAVKTAAKSNSRIAWAVASNRKLPLEKNSIDLILSLFGFPIWDSFKATLSTNGHLLLVDPAPDHLIELRKIIYPEVKATQLSSLENAIAAGFSLAREEALEFSFALEDQNSIQDLLAMTPHGYRIKSEGRERLAQVKQLTTKASVVFRMLRS